MDDDGGFVVVWQDRAGADGSGYGVFGQRFDSAGAPVGGQFQVNTYTTGNQFSYGVAAAADGRFVVSWDSLTDGSGFGLSGQRYDAAGAPLGADFVVNQDTTGGQNFSSVSSDRQFNFVAAWQSDASDGSSYGIRGQRFDAQGARRGAEFGVNTYTTFGQHAAVVAGDEVGNFLVAWHSNNQDGSDLGVFAQRFGGLIPTALRVDIAGNDVLEPGEVSPVAPTWRNVNGAALTFAANLGGADGPPNGIPLILDSVGVYGTVANGASSECTTCYSVLIPNPPARPALHWDGSVVETITPDAQGQQKTWRLHVGASFDDVAAASSFYPFIETLLHHGITGGCAGSTYCPLAVTSREQMAVFVLVAKEGSGYRPPACGAPMFPDVPASNPFCRWVEELARRGVVAGCGGGNYCPTNPVTREQMAVFVLRTLDPALQPPACTAPTYNDVPASSGFCRWIEELTRRSVVTGCGGGNYCPAAPVTREEMGVFISATFGLALYGP
jgi:S-layer homology domain